MFRLPLFRIRAFSGGSVATFLSTLSRGGLMFMLILWLQGIWLPEHGYSFEAFYFAAACCVLAAVASWLRGGKYYHTEHASELEPEEIEAEIAAVS